MQRPILDPCCGEREIHFNKRNTLVDYRDNRVANARLYNGDPILINPDTIGDVLRINAPDGAYHLVILDPPYLPYNTNNFLSQKYGKLPNDWRKWLKDAFDECWRVLANDGTLVFRWRSYKIPLETVLLYAPAKPVVGNKKPLETKAHWVLFFKHEEEG